MPYATDNIQCDYISHEAALLAWEKGAKVVVLPTIPFGVNTGQLDIKLDININPSTQAVVLQDIVDTLARHDIGKLLVLNGHGGNDFRQMIREIQPEYPNTFICTADWYRVDDWAKYFEDTGDHAGEVETSTMLHIAPDLVLPLSEAGDGAERKFKLRGLRQPWAWAPREWSEASEDTGIGNPAKATAEKGKKFLEYVIQELADFLVELEACDINDMYE